VKRLLAACCLGLALGGCSALSGVLPNGNSTGGASSAASSTPVPLVVPDSVEQALAANLPTHEAASDLTWDAAGEIPVALSDSGSSGQGVQVVGQVVTITTPGDYRLTGSLSDGQLVVDTDQAGVVRLIFDGASVTCGTSSALWAKNADKVVVWLADGSRNSLTDAESYAAGADTEPDAALFSAVDLTIAGPGSLTVNGRAGDAITGKDGLVVAGGVLDVTAADDAIKGRDYLVVRDGSIKLAAGGDAMTSTNDSDEAAGYVLVSGGSVDAAAGADCVDAVTDAIVTGGELKLSCGDDGIHGDRLTMVSDGRIDIAKGYEGLEAAAVVLFGGEISVVASDDGVNAANGGTLSVQDAWPGGQATPDSGRWGRGGQGLGRGGGWGGGETPEDAALVIAGGKLTVTAQGDGLDSNGTAAISGGTIVLDVPNRGMEGPIDVVGDFTITGGTITDPDGNPIK
jgi:hypothetical protein